MEGKGKGRDKRSFMIFEREGVGEKGGSVKMVEEYLYIEKTSPQHHLVDLWVFLVPVEPHRVAMVEKEGWALGHAAMSKQKLHSTFLLSAKVSVNPRSPDFFSNGSDHMTSPAVPEKTQ